MEDGHRLTSKPTEESSQNTEANMAASEILRSISAEVENGLLVEKREHLEHMVMQTPSAWFHPILLASGDVLEDGVDGVREACTETILLLLCHCHSSLKAKSEEEVDVGDAYGKKLQQHSKEAHAALSIISIILRKLVSKEHEERVPSNDEREDTVQPECGLQAHEDDKKKVHNLQNGPKTDSEGTGPSNKMDECQIRPSGTAEGAGHFSIRAQNEEMEMMFPQEVLERLQEGSSREEEAAKDGGTSTGTNKVLRHVVKAVTGPCVVLCAYHYNKHPWTTRGSQQASKSLLSQLTQTCGYHSLPGFLQGSSQQHGEEEPSRGHHLIPKGAFGLALGELKKRLTRGEWKKNIGTQQAFVWLLAHIKHPYLGEHLELCLPPSLLFVDDYKMENKIVGIQCLQYILDNVDPTEMRWYGRAEVVYEALHPLLYNYKPDLIETLYPCMLRVLRVLERDPKKADRPRQPSRYDKVLQVVLTNMEGEQRIPVRQACARHLGPFIEAMGITVLWHMKRLIRVLASYLEASDGTAETGRILSLGVLQTVIVQTWPRIPCHCVDLMKPLLRLLVDISMETTNITAQARNTLRTESIKSLILLRRCCGSVVEDSINKVIGSDIVNSFTKECLEQVLAE
ncbi:TELO2-interacting protein 2-like [Diadema antillarum]|uniref:TELO2-interacting protein 2-like n=1 Tax=Diadema antillarum TaxID=105358 RepID=UPI003A853746